MLNEVKSVVKAALDNASFDEHQVIEISVPAGHLLRLFSTLVERRIGSTMTTDKTHIQFVAFGNENGITLRVTNVDEVSDGRAPRAFEAFFPKAMVSRYSPFHMTLEGLMLLSMKDWDEEVVPTTYLVVGSSMAGIVTDSVSRSTLFVGGGQPYPFEYVRNGGLTRLIASLDTRGRWIMWGWIDRDNFTGLPDEAANAQMGTFHSGHNRRGSVINYYLGQRVTHIPVFNARKNLRLTAPFFHRLWNTAGNPRRRNRLKGAIYCYFDGTGIAFEGVDYSGRVTLEHGKHAGRNHAVALACLNPATEQEKNEPVVLPHEFYHGLTFCLVGDDIDVACIDVGIKESGQQYVGFAIRDGPREGYQCHYVVDSFGFKHRWENNTVELFDCNALATMPGVQEPPRHTIVTGVEDEMTDDEREMIAMWYNEWLIAKIRAGDEITQENQELAERLGLTGE